MSDLEQEHLSPELPEVDREKTFKRREENSLRVRDELVLKEYSGDDRLYLLAETPVLRGMLGFTIDDTLNLLEEEYEVVFEDENVLDGMEYGNGWAIFYAEE